MTKKDWLGMLPNRYTSPDMKAILCLTSLVKELEKRIAYLKSQLKKTTPRHETVKVY